MRDETYFQAFENGDLQTLLLMARNLAAYYGSPYVDLIHLALASVNLQMVTYRQTEKGPEFRLPRQGVDFLLRQVKELERDEESKTLPLSADFKDLLDGLLPGEKPDVNRCVEKLFSKTETSIWTPLLRALGQGQLLFYGLDAQRERQLLFLFSAEGREGENQPGFERPAPVEKSAPNQTSKEEASALDFLIDLTAKARAGKLDPLVGREKELNDVIRTLCRRRKNNPVLLGDPGVGKTAIVEGLASLIAEGSVPPMLQNKKLYELSINTLVADTRYRGDFEGRIKKIIDYIVEEGHLLFIDELHSLIGSGATSGNENNDGSNTLKPYLARGELSLIGATTTEEYRRFVTADGALERRFWPINVDEPDGPTTERILTRLLPEYASFHGVTFADDVVPLAVKLSSRYIADRHQPDKSLDLIDEAAAQAKLEIRSSSTLKDLTAKINALKDTLRQTAQSEADSLWEELHDLQLELRQGKEEPTSRPRVTANHLRLVLSSWTGIPADAVSEDESRRLLSLENRLAKDVIGQPEAIDALARALRRNRSGLRQGNRPVGSFLFLGPSGVGKTHLAKALARHYFGTEKALIQVNMSEFMEAIDVSKLIGSPPGYVGHEERGSLTEAVHRRPHSLVLFDEVEKAHRTVTNLLLQILEEGKLTDGKGQTIDFKHCLIVLTSNLGNESRQSALGFPAPLDGPRQDGAKTRRAARDFFSPELMARFDETLIFNALTAEDLSRVFDRLAAPVLERAAQAGLEIRLDDELKEQIVKETAHQEGGARPLRRLIQTHLEDPLALALLQGTKGGPWLLTTQGLQRQSLVLSKN